MKPHGRPMGPHGAPMGCPWGAMGPHGFVKTTGAREYIRNKVLVGVLFDQPGPYIPGCRGFDKNRLGP